MTHPFWSVPAALALLLGGCHSADGVLEDASREDASREQAPADATIPDAAPFDGSAQLDGPGDPFAGELDVSLQFASGSRLLAKKRVSSGGTPTFDGWYDSQLQVDCVFRAAADGVHRCLPELPRDHTGWFLSYGDATCSNSSMVLYQAASGCSALVPSYWTNWMDVCDAPVYPVIGSLPPGPPYYYVRRTDGTCISSVPTVAVALGAPLPPTNFTSAKFVDGPAQAGLVPRYLVAADGARGFAGWHDPASGEACQLRRAADGVFRCLSTQAGDTLHFADKACTKLSFKALSCEPAPSSVAVRGTECPTTYEAREVGAAVQPPVMYSGATCSRTFTYSEATTVYEVGAPIPPGNFLPVAVEAPPAVKRLERTVLAVGSLLQSVGDFYDHVRSEYCALFIAGDGKLRCLPGKPLPKYVNQFTDSACTSPLLYYKPPSCDAPPSPLAAYTDRSTCPNRHRIFAIGPHSGAVYTVDASGACTVKTSTPSNGHARGAEIPPTSFEEFL